MVSITIRMEKDLPHLTLAGCESVCAHVCGRGRIELCIALCMSRTLSGSMCW